MSSAHWLKQRRESLKITQEQLAERLSAGGMPITKAAISKWEMGKTPLPLQTPENRKLIADALELSISELLVLAGYEIDNDMTPQARIIADMYDRLTDTDRETVLMMLFHLTSKTRSDDTAPAATGKASTS